MKRVRTNRSTTPGAQAQLTFNEASVAVRHVIVGPVISAILGGCTVATECGQYAALTIVNTTAAALYVAIGDSSVVAPTGVVDGIAVPANGVMHISTGEQTHVIASAPGLGVYKQKEDFILEDVQ